MHGLSLPLQRERGVREEPAETDRRRPPLPPPRSPTTPRAWIRSWAVGTVLLLGQHRPGRQPRPLPPYPLSCSLLLTHRIPTAPFVSACSQQTTMESSLVKTKTPSPLSSTASLPSFEHWQPLTWNFVRDVRNQEFTQEHEKQAPNISSTVLLPCFYSVYPT